jgi:signal transduction histidine kinase
MEIDGRPFVYATVRDETKVKKLQVMLRQSDRLTSMGALAAVAHDINNPLTYVLQNIASLLEDIPKLGSAIARFSQAARAEFGSDQLARLLGGDAALLEPAALSDLAERAQEALDGAERIKTISRAVGALSHVEITERYRVDLNYTVQCATTMALTVIKYRAQLVTDYGVLPLVWASTGKLSQVFLNLLVNAAHAIEEGDLLHNRIEIRTWTHGDVVFAEIKDTGRGISEADLPRIFDPFFTTAAGVGSGLGLPMCRNIISEFGGNIEVESQLGVGTCFTVCVPAQRGVSLSPAADAGQDGSARAERRTLNGSPVRN